MKVIAGLSHQAKDAAIWWDEIDKLREKYGADTDAIVEALSDSGKYSSWDIKLRAALITTLRKGLRARARDRERESESSRYWRNPERPSDICAHPEGL